MASTSLIDSGRWIGHNKSAPLLYHCIRQSMLSEGMCMKKILTHVYHSCLALVLLAAWAASPAFAQADPASDDGLDPFDPALLTDLLPDDDYSPTLIAVGISGSSFVVSWKGDGILQVSDKPTGPWESLWNASS